MVIDFSGKSLHLDGEHGFLLLPDMKTIWCSGWLECPWGTKVKILKSNIWVWRELRLVIVIQIKSSLSSFNGDFRQNDTSALFDSGRRALYTVNFPQNHSFVYIFPSFCLLHHFIYFPSYVHRLPHKVNTHLSIFLSIQYQPTSWHRIPVIHAVWKQQKRSWSVPNTYCSRLLWSVRCLPISKPYHFEMERLPTEILDHVRSLQATTQIHLALTKLSLQITSYVKDCKTLAALRLVDKAFCRTASRRLFRCVILKVYEPAIMTKIEALASSEYAQFVREVVFSPEPVFKEAGWCPIDVFEPSILTHLTTVLKKLSRLETVYIQSLEGELTFSWHSVALRAIAGLKHHNVKQLEMSFDNSPYLNSCIVSR